MDMDEVDPEEVDDVIYEIVAFMGWTLRHPYPPDVPTVEVVTAARRWLDEACPDWRWRVFERDEDKSALRIGLVIGGGRTVWGTLTQRPSAVTGEAA